MGENSLIYDVDKQERTPLKERKMQIPASSSETLPKASDANENVSENHDNFESSPSKNSFRETIISLPDITFPSSRDPHRVEKLNRYSSSPKSISRKKKKKKKKRKRMLDSCAEKKTKLHKRSKESKRSRSRKRKKHRKHSSDRKKKYSSSCVEEKREKRHSRSIRKKERRDKYQDNDALAGGNSTKSKCSASSTDRHRKKNGPRNRAESITKSKWYGEESRSKDAKPRSNYIVLQEEDTITKGLVCEHRVNKSVENTLKKSSSALVQLPTSEKRNKTGKDDGATAMPFKFQNQSWKKQRRSSLIYSKSVSVQLMCEESDGEDEDEEHDLAIPPEVIHRASSTESELEKIKNRGEQRASMEVDLKTEPQNKVQCSSSQDRRSSSSLSYSPIEKYPHRYLDILSDMPKKIYRRTRTTVGNEQEESHSSDSTDNLSGDKLTDCPAVMPGAKPQQQTCRAENFLKENCENLVTTTASASISCSDNGPQTLNEDDNLDRKRTMNASAAITTKQVSQAKQNRMATSLQQFLSASLRNREASYSDSDSSCGSPLRRCTLKSRDVISRSSNSSHRSPSKSASSISGRSSRSRLACRKRKRRRRSNSTSVESGRSAHHSRSYSSASSYRSRSRSASSSSSGSTSEGRSKRYCRTLRSRDKKSRSSHSDCSSVSTKSRSRARSRSLSIPRRKGSPSFLERRRITSARKRPIPYQRSSVLRSPSTSSSSSRSRSRSSSLLRRGRRSCSLSPHSSWSSGFHRRRSSSYCTPSPIVRRSPVAWPSKHSESHD